VAAGDALLLAAGVAPDDDPLVAGVADVAVEAAEVDALAADVVVALELPPPQAARNAAMAGTVKPMAVIRLIKSRRL